MQLSENLSHEAAGLRKMKPQGLNRLSQLRRGLVWLKRQWLVRVFGMTIDPSAELSLSARLDKTYPCGVHIGAHSYVAFDAAILTHDRTRGLYLDTIVGENCFIGARSLILPGVRIGDGAIVGAGSVVTKHVPARTIVAGNPARAVHENAATGHFGRLASADRTEHAIASQ